MPFEKTFRTIRPGYLVALKTSVEGGVTYDKNTIRATDDGVLLQWETTRTMPDPDGFKLAQAARSEAAAKIRRVCSATSFGLLCPFDNGVQLDAAIGEAQRLVDAHNAQARTSIVKLFVLKGRVAADDEQAARAIASDVGDVVAAMDNAIAKLDPVAIRKAASEAKQMLQVLGDDKQALASKAIDAARKVAREIVKRIQNGGETAEAVMADMTREQGSIAAARMAFLDHEPMADAPAGDALPAVNVGRFAELDSTPGAPASEPTNEQAVPPAEAPAAGQVQP